MTARTSAKPRGINQRCPFGTPDGSRADLTEIMDGFVGIDDEAADLGDPGENLSARIIVGRMGSGKTLYLRRTQAFAADDHAIYADEVRSDLPSTQDVIRVCHRYESHLITETWIAIWRKALLRALSSHLLFANPLHGALSYEERERLTGRYAALLGRPEAPRSPYVEVAEILHKHQNRTALDRYLRDDGWADLTTLLAGALRNSKPVYFFLDAIDEQFAHAPMYWLKFQKGLFYAVMALLREPGFGARLHVVAGVRDIVYSDILRSEHSGRYRDEPHIRVLNWDAIAVSDLLAAKIARLGPDHLMDPDVEGVPGWLGAREIDNTERGVTELVEDYVLRHTRLLPRDLVEIGNVLSREVAAAKTRGAEALAPETIRRAVDQAAAGFADTQLRVCANQIVADMMPANAVAQGYAEVYLGDTQYARGIVEDLRQVLAAFQTDRFDGVALNRARAEASRRLQHHVRPDSDLDPGLHVLDVLWQHGLLGYEQGSGHVRFSASLDVNDFHLPDRRAYVLHPCVAHTAPVASIGDPILMSGNT
ncbi:MAG: hypothetical protein QOK16_2830 [Solirubrobacteraceae bacterium]|nr:hypothetical protein [Solirubrobacteraceae bacterium]